MRRGDPVSRVLMIAGFPRCGTTSLFNWMAEHPDICPSSEKETYYFADNVNPAFRKTNYRLHGVEGFMTYFDHCDHAKAKVFLEATPTHVYEKTAFEVLPTLTPLPQIIFVLRKPSERVYSMYRHGKYTLYRIPDPVSFRDFVSIIKDKPMVADKMFGRFPHLRYALEQSIYIDHIRKWMQRFGSENILAIVFEQLSKYPLKHMKELSDRIGINDVFWENYPFLRRNESIRVRSRLLHKLMIKTLGTMGINAVRRRANILAEAYLRLNSQKIPGRSEEDVVTLKDLDKFFLSSVNDLGATLKMDLSSWS